MLAQIKAEALIFTHLMGRGCRKRLFRIWDFSWLFVMKSAVCHSLPLRAAVAQYFRQISTIIRAYIATDFTPPISCTIGDEEPLSSDQVQAVDWSSKAGQAKKSWSSLADAV
jgi:hypothetical protein